MPKFTWPMKGTIMVVSPAATTIRGTAAKRVRRGFCHWRSPEDCWGFCTTKSSTNPTRQTMIMEIMPAKRNLSAVSSKIMDPLTAKKVLKKINVVMPAKNPPKTTSPPERGTRGLSFLFMSYTTKLIFLKYLISQGVKKITTKKLTNAARKGRNTIGDSCDARYKKVSSR